MPTISDDPGQYDEAVRAFRKRVPMPDWQWDALTEAEREFAFKVSGVAQADLVTDAWEAIDRALRDGTGLEEFKASVGEQLEAAWGKAEPARLETIFRTNVQGAYNGGRHEVMTDPEVKKARPYWRFDGVDDGRQSEICEALDGTVRPADDPFWSSHTPPLHFNAVTGDTAIVTNGGVIAASQMKPGMQVLSHRRRWRTVTAVLHKVVARRRVLSLHLASGRILRVTNEHPVLVHATPDGLAWRQAGDLKAGDHVLEHGHQMIRTAHTLTVDADNAPPLTHEPFVAHQIARLAGRAPVDLPVDLHSNHGGDERQVKDVRPDSVLGDSLAIEEVEQTLFCWSEVLSVGNGLGSRGQNPGVAGSDRVGAGHALTVAPMNLGGRGALAPGPVSFTASLRDDGRVPAGNSHLVALGAHGDTVSLAPSRQDAVAKVEFPLERANAALADPVFPLNEAVESDPVGSVEWHSSTIVLIAADEYFGELCDLSVAVDESYVAGGVVVHNCRSVITPLSDEEAAEEGVDDEAPATDADAGFGRAPTVDGGGNWEPDTASYPEPIRAVLDERLP